MNFTEEQIRAMHRALDRAKERLEILKEEFTAAGPQNRAAFLQWVEATYQK